MSEAKDYLNRIKWYDVLIDSKLEEMERLNDLVRRITPSMSGAAGGGNGDKLGDTVAKIVDLQDEINRKIDEFVALKQAASSMLSQITRTDYYKILHMRYIRYMSFESIAQDMGCTYRWATKMHGQALQEFDKVLKAQKRLEEAEKRENCKKIFR